MVIQPISKNTTITKMLSLATTSCNLNAFRIKKIILKNPTKVIDQRWTSQIFNSWVTSSLSLEPPDVLFSVTIFAIAVIEVLAVELHPTITNFNLNALRIKQFILKNPRKGIDRQWTSQLSTTVWHLVCL